MNQPSKGMESCKLSHCVFFPSQGSPLWLAARVLYRLLQLIGPEKSCVSTWQCNIPRSFPWLMITQVKRKPSAGETRWPQRAATQTQSMDAVHKANQHLQRGQSASNAFPSAAPISTAIFPTFPTNRGRQELPHSHTIPATWQMSKISPWSS